VKAIHKSHWDTVDSEADCAQAKNRNGRTVSHHDMLAGDFGVGDEVTNLLEEMIRCSRVRNSKMVCWELGGVRICY
jgi:hypothetical protein